MTIAHRLKSTELPCRVAAIARRGLEKLDGDPLTKTLMAGTIDRDGYGYFLVQTFHQIHDGAGPMLVEAGRNLAAQGKYPRAAGLMSAKEDEGTHDRWALSDALALGMSEAAIYAVEPSEAVKAYRAYTSYLARHQPVGVLGVAYVLETFGCERAGQAATNLVTHSGIPSIEKAVSFLAGHGTEDQDHVRVLAEVLDDVDDPHDAAVVELAAELTTQLYPSFFHGG